MNFQHNEDRQLLADSLNRFVSERYPPAKREQIAYSKTGFSPELWQEFAELGAIGALFPASAGGFGGAGFDISIVFEALGRGLVVEPFLGALLVGQALIHAGDSAQQAQLAPLIEGKLIASLAHEEPDTHYEETLVRTRARREDEGWVLEGAKAVVQQGEAAQLLLVSARTAGDEGEEAGLSLFLVPGDSSGLHWQGYPKIDGGHAAELRLEAVKLPAAALLGKEGAAYPLLERVLGYGLLALSSEALGAMDIVRQSTVEYLQTRKQFGVPIGSFQALQHRMADLLLEIEQARSAVINAAAAIDLDDRLEREKRLSATKHSIGRIGIRVAEEAIQLHGGIGMTWELPLAHYAKRLVLIDHQLGDEDHHLERYIALSTAARKAAA